MLGKSEPYPNQPDGVLGLNDCLEGHEPETFALAIVVSHDPGRDDHAKALEELPEAIIRQLLSKVLDVEVAAAAARRTLLLRRRMAQSLGTFRLERNTLV